MKSAFIDTSALASILFKEPAYPAVLNILEGLETVSASCLLEAEIRSAAVRESIDQGDVDGVLSKVEWVLPDRPLSHEIRSIVSKGIPLRGAELWHLACALYLAGDPANLPFVTLDGGQAGAAERLGFKVLPAVSPRSSGAREPQAVYGAKKSRGKVHA